MTGARLFSSLITGAVTAIPVSIVAAVANALLPGASAHLRPLLLFAALTAFGSAFVVALLLEPLYGRTEAALPHGVWPTVIEIGVPIVTALVVAPLTVGPGHLVLTLVVSTVGFLPTLLLTSPWSPGVSDAEVTEQSKAAAAVTRRAAREYVDEIDARARAQADRRREP